MSEAQALFAVLRQSADVETVAAIERLVRDAPDRELSRINVVNFATRTGLDAERVIAAFLHAARIGLFEMSWNVLCPGCGGVLDANATLKTVNRTEYVCGLCAAGYEPTLDEMVEVTFTVSERIRRIAAHDPGRLPFAEYFRQIFWSSGVDLPETIEALVGDITLEAIELPPGEKAILSLTLPAEFAIVFDPVTHSAQFLDVRGRPPAPVRACPSFSTRRTHRPVPRSSSPARFVLPSRTGPISASCRASGSPGKSCTTCSAGAALSSRRSAC